ncbi:MAG TPA: DUF4350 domain-containing protein [Acidobacteriaceae bacterium]|nr:DUF4350 domain-containing protein [Acidobacteriaceae bacterium]
MSGRLSGDVRLLLWVTASVLVIILVAAFLAPARGDYDYVPSTWNTGSAGAKAAYLLLAQLGYKTARWEQPAAQLSQVDAAHTTLVLADAYLSNVRDEEKGIADFLKRGGRVLATGAESALLLPSSSIKQADQIFSGLCFTTPQSLSAMGRAGKVAMPVPIQWIGRNAQVDQACGDNAVVVHYSVNAGEAVWWSSAAPLSNRGLHRDADLRLLLASVGAPGRTVLFDEYIHGERKSIASTIKGTPVAAIFWQLALVTLLLILSFSRRNGPIRALVSTPRTSPLEFAESMGALYGKAGATDVAVGAAERRLMEFLHTAGGIPQQTLRSGPEAIAAAVAARFAYTTTDLQVDLQAAQEAAHAKLRAKAALELVRRLDRHIASLRARMRDSHAAQQNGDKRD